MIDNTWRPEIDVWANMPAPYLDALRRESSEWAKRVLPAYWNDFLEEEDVD